MLCIMLPLASLGPLEAQTPTAEAPSAERDAVEFNLREGTPNIFDKLSHGNPVKIAYLGGSITAQEGWRVQSRAWLKRQFPETGIEEINAAIGGTGSDLGVFRIQSDVLDHKPDLLFVEFAVNDAKALPERIRKAVEGIVRKTWRELPGCDIVFVYTITLDDIETLKSGKVQRSAGVMEEVADHYGIPSVHFGIEVARLEREGKLVMKSADGEMTRVSGSELDAAADLPTNAQGQIVFSKDGVHPYPETGHRLYTRALVNALSALRKTEAPPQLHTLKPALVKENWETARQISLTPGLLEGPAAQADQAKGVGKEFLHRVSSLWKLEPGAVLRFKFKGTKAALYDLLGPDGCMLEITVDEKARKITRFDGYCTYYRLGILNIADNLPDSVHEVTLKVLDESPDKTGILFERNRDDLLKHPEKYNRLNWYAGAILVVGEIVE